MPKAYLQVSMAHPNAAGGHMYVYLAGAAAKHYRRNFKVYPKGSNICL